MGTIQAPAFSQVSPAVLGQLQRTVGNRATVRFLAGNGPADDIARTIQRFPSGVLEQPLKSSQWKQYTKTVKKSGEGVSGGAFFFRSKRGEPKDVVVKAEDGSPEETEAANSQLASAGISVPRARNVSISGKEGQDIIAAASKRGGYDLTLTGQGNSANTTFLRVMSLSSGNSLSSILKKAGGAAPDKLAASIDETVTLLMSESIRQQLTTLIATDIILGNTDRINDSQSNLGNLMVDVGKSKSAALPRALGPRVTAIDSEALVSEKAWKGSSGQVKSSLKALSTDPAAIIENFLTGVKAYLRFANPEAEQLFENHPQYAALKAALVTSLELAAFKQASLSMVAKESKGPVDDEMKRRRGLLWNKLS